MRAKRSIRKTAESFSVKSDKVPIINGLYHEESNRNSLISTHSISSSKLAERWNGMDYEKYFKFREHGSVIDNDLPNVSHWSKQTLVNFPPTTSDDSSLDSSTGSAEAVLEFYKNVAPDFWNYFPKTDYTYLPSSPWYEKEYAPGVPVIPNMSRRALRLGRSSPESVISNSEIKTTEIDSPNAPISNGHSINRRYTRLYQKNGWSWNSWRRTFETIKTVIITTITTTVTTTTEAVVHPMRKPCLSFPLLFILLALLFYLLFFIGTESEEGDKIPLMSAPWLQTDTLQQLTSFSSIILKPFIWLYKLANSCLQLFTTCVLMIPTLLNQLAQSLNTFIFIFFDMLAGWFSQSSVINTTDSRQFDLKTVEKLSVLDPAMIRQIVSEMLSEREKERAEGTATMKRTEIDEIESLKEFMRKVTERLESAENISYDNKKILDEINPWLKNLEEKISINQLNTGQSAEVAHIEGANRSVIGWSEVSEKVMHIVKNMLNQYHADRTGIPDYALMSNGGTILSIRCTQTYTQDSGNLYLFGIPVWNVNSNPEVIIKPGTMPGECWAFEGSEGYVVIRLAMPIYVSGFTLEHTPKELTIHGNIKSAPYQFSVWALKELKDEEPHFLGRFKFLDNGESMQYFEAEKLETPVELVELRIESNHGSVVYTCLYRFRVHGKPA